VLRTVKNINIPQIKVAGPVEGMLNVAKYPAVDSKNIKIFFFV